MKILKLGIDNTIVTLMDDSVTVPVLVERFNTTDSPFRQMLAHICNELHTCGAVMHDDINFTIHGDEDLIDLVLHEVTPVTLDDL